MKLEKRGDPANGNNEVPEGRQERDETPLRKRQLNVLIYMVVLFAVALGLIVLSYFIQHRANANTITDMTDKHSEITLQALKNIEELQNKNQELMKKMQEQERELLDVKDELEESKAELQKSQEELTNRDGELAQIREELAGIEDQLNTAKAETQRLEANSRVLQLYRAMKEKQPTAVYISELEQMEQYLDDEYMKLYQELLKEMKGEIDD